MLKSHGAHSRETAENLRLNGFCLISRRRLQHQREYDTMEERRFALSQRTKHFMTPTRCPSSGVPEAGFSSFPTKDVFHYSAFSLADKSPGGMKLPMGAYWRAMTALGDSIFSGINQYVLNHLHVHAIYRCPRVEHVFPDDESFGSWMNAIKDSDRHVLSSFRYHSTNDDELHAAAHVDKGVLTICENPNDLEVMLRDGKWVALGPQPAGTFAVLVGYSLECATGGIFRAVRHRVHNNGNRRSRVMKLRFSPHLVLYPPSVIGLVEPRLRGEVSDPTDSLSVEDLLDSFNATHDSINAPDLHGQAVADAADPTVLGEMGYFSNLSIDLLYCVFDWLRDIRDLIQLSITCRSLRVVAGRECLVIPAAESTGISWDWALDRIGPNILDLRRVADRWLSILGEELMFKMKKLIIRIRDQTELTCFTLKNRTKMKRVFMAYAQRKGVSVSRLRFLLNGETIEGEETPYTSRLEDGDQVYCILEDHLP